MRPRFSIGFRIYGIIGLSFIGLIGLAVVQAHTLHASLVDQRRNELQHLVQSAVSLVRAEYESSRTGEISEAAAQKRAVEQIARLRYANGDYFWINDMTPRMIVHPIKPDLNGQDLGGIADPSGKRLFVEFVDVVRRQRAGFVEYSWPKPGKDSPQPKISYVSGFEPWGWVVGSGAYLDDLEAQQWSSDRNAIVVASSIVILLGAVTGFIARTMSSALSRMTEALSALGAGQFDVALPGLQRTDEIGDMARSIDRFKTKAIAKAREEAAVEEDRLRSADRTKAAAIRIMAETVEREADVAVGEVAARTKRMMEGADSLHVTARTLSGNSGSVAAAAEEALANAQTVANASALMTASIARIASQVSSSRELTRQAVDASSEAQATIGKLSEVAGRVGAVTNLITAIAGQTNLLALNATIEAARAGEAGRGFAVVASEVKSLAQQTAKATDEISQQIAEMQASTLASVRSIDGIGAVIRNVEAVSSEIADAIDEQNAATLEITRTVEETSLAAREVAAQIASVSREAVETGRLATAIRDGSIDIVANVENLRTTLMGTIRTTAYGEGSGPLSAPAAAG